jgi:hypothetical protein
MSVAVTYPLFVFEKDDKSMRLIEDQGRILFHLEAIDIENDEYVFWDSTGGVVNVSVKKENVSVSPCKEVFPLRDAFTAYANANGLGELTVTGAPTEVWGRVQREIDARPKNRSFLAKIFR